MNANEYNRDRIRSGDIPDSVITKIVELWQEEHGLDVDGKLGPITLKSISSETVFEPDWTTDSKRKWAERLYGAFRFKSQPNGRIVISSTWVDNNIVRIELHNGKKVRINKKIAEHFKATFKIACEKSGYTPTSVQTFVPRHTLWNTSKSVSAHSWGCAVDFDPPKNPMGGKIKKTGRPSVLRTHPEFAQVFKDAGWTWGGDWRMKDDMHFELRKEI